MSVHGKSAVITGGGRGIGRAIAEQLLKCGAKVCLLDVLEAELRQTWTELKEQYGESNITTCKADVTNKSEFRAAIQNTMEAFGHLDILVNNACIQKEGQWKAMLNVNLAGVIHGTLLALEFMKPGGTVVNISSICGIEVVHPDTSLVPVYTASKAGVIAYTRCFALNPEVLRKKVRLVCLCPRPTDTFLLHDRSPDKCWDVDAFYANDRGPVMTPEEVASVFLSVIQDGTNHGKVAVIRAPNKYEFV